MSLIAFMRSAKMDWGHYVGYELPIFGYDFEPEAVSGVVAM